MRNKYLAIFFIFIIFSVSGCVSLRKKFVRKKKYEKETPVYVDFKSYPSKPSKEAYTDYYLYVRGWMDELKELVLQKGNLKRQKHAIDEAITNLEQIISFFNSEGKEKIYPLYEQLISIKKDIERSRGLDQMQTSTILSKIESFKRQFEANFSYTDAEKWMD